MATAQKVSSDLAGANKKKKEKKKKEKAKLSFAVDGEDEEEEAVSKSSDKKRSNEDSDGMCDSRSTRTLCSHLDSLSRRSRSEKAQVHEESSCRHVFPP